jgi:hypothetical protein
MLKIQNNNSDYRQYRVNKGPDRASAAEATSRRRIFRTACVVIAAVAFAACQPGVGPGATTPPAPTCAAGCIEAPKCKFGVWEPENDTSDPLRAQLGCGALFLYDSGATFGVLGGVGSFCPDSSANRALLHARGKRGYLPGYCQTCIGVPAGMLFVFWRVNVGPSCPSGCLPGPPIPSF